MTKQTSKKQNIEEMLNGQALSLFEAMPQPALLLSDAGNILAANEAAQQLYGYTEQDLSTRSFSSLSASGTSTTKGVQKHQTADGRSINVEVKFAALNATSTGLHLATINIVENPHETPASLTDHPEYLQSAIEIAEVGVWRWNIQTGETLFNESWANMIGYSLTEIQPTTIATWHNFAHPDDLAEGNKRVQDLLDGRADVYEMETRLRHKDGHWVWVMDRGRIVSHSPDGKPLCLAGTHINISALKTAQADVEASHDLLTQYNQKMPGMIYQFRWDAKGNASMPYASSQIKQLFGCTPDEVREDFSPIGRNIHPQDMAHLAGMIQAAVDTRSDYQDIFRYTLPGQPTRHIFARATPQVQPNGDILFFGYATDVSDITAVALEKAQVEERFVSIMDQIEESVVLLDREFRFLFVNKAAERRGNLPAEQVIGRSFLEDHPSFITDEMIERRKRVMRTRKFETERFAFTQKDGSIQWIENHIQPLVEGILIISYDITDHTNSQAALQEREERYYNLAANSPDIIYTLDTNNSRIDYCNRPLIYGHEPQDFARLQHKRELVHLSDIALVKHALEALRKVGEPTTVEFRLKDADGQYHWVSQRQCMLTPGLMLVTLTDIHKFKQAEEALRLSESKFAAIYHNINDGTTVASAQTGCYIEVNEPFLHMFNITRDKVVGHEFMNLGLLRTPNACQIVKDALREHGRMGPTEFQYIRRDGKPGWASYTASSFFIEDEEYWLTSAIDITDRLAAEQALADSERRFRMQFENTIDGLIIFDEDDNLILANNAGRRLMALPDEGLPQVKMAEFVPHYDEMYAKLIPVLRERGSTSGSGKMKRMDGTLIPLEYTITLIPTSEKASLTSVSIRDMSVVTQARDDLQRFFDLVPDMVCVLDPETGIAVRMNQAWQKSLGFSVEELMARPMLDFVHPEDAEKTLKNRHEKVLKGSVSKYTNRYIAKDGSTHWLEWETTLSPDNKLIYAAARDITERLKQEQELQRAEQRFNQAFRNSPIAINIFDHNTGVSVDCNEAYANIVGMPASQIIGHTADEVGLKLEPQKRKLWLAAVDEQGVARDMEITCTLPNGTTRYLVGSFVNVEIAGRKLVMVLSYDQTQQKEAERLIRDANEELEKRVSERTIELEESTKALQKALATRDEFLAAVSHELRTPLTGVLGLSQVLLMPNVGTLNPKQTQAVQNIEQNGQRLLRTINDMITYTQLTAGSLTPQPRECSLDMICSLGMRSIEVEAREKKIELDYQSNLGQVMFKVDERLLRDVLANLLDNAIKFTDPGGHVGIEVDANAEKTCLYITVTDTGIGISEADQQRLFQPFTQIDARLARIYEGTGLGLAIVRKTMELLNGKVSLVSEHGKGTRVTLTLPW